MIAQVKEIHTYSPEEYLELEIPSVDKHDYIDGEIRLMPGGMPNHNRIIGNLSAALNFAFKSKPYEALLPISGFGFLVNEPILIQIS